MIKYCKNCSERISIKRLELLPDAKHCVNCSEEDKVKCVDIIYHKTGNTIQVMDSESAAKIAKASRRTGYGSMASMRGSSAGAYKLEQLKTTSMPKRKPKEDDFYLVGNKFVYYMDLGLEDKAKQQIETAVQSNLITGIQSRKLRELLTQLYPDIIW